ncbi:MAG: hypothetical protein IPG96_06960 [Proteobacteria bacterium]|nr:hypothetical protein [Pseudomonadota bacterium]
MLTHERRARVVLVAFAACFLALAGCTTGPGNKPGTLRWKQYTAVTPLEFSPVVWTTGGLRHEMTAADYEKHHTVARVTGHKLRFEFKVTNISAESVDLDKVPRPQASLTLKDGRPAPSMVWIYFPTKRNAPLEPGQTTKAQLFDDNGVPEGARPEQLRIGDRVVNWP